MLDIRSPIGILFLLVGGLLAIYGATTPASLYTISLGYNLNLLWGGCMALFGAVMLTWKVLRPHRGHAPEEVGAAAPEVRAS